MSKIIEICMGVEKIHRYQAFSLRKQKGVNRTTLYKTTKTGLHKNIHITIFLENNLQPYTYEPNSGTLFKRPIIHLIQYFIDK